MLERKCPSIHIPKNLLILKPLNPQSLRQIVQGHETEHYMIKNPSIQYSL